MAISRKKIKLFLQALGPIIFIYILSKIDYGIILKQIKLLKWYLLLIAILVMILEIIVRSLKWRTILSSLDIQVAKIKSVSLYWLGAFVGIVTPGRIGELAKVYFLRNKGHSAFRSFFSIIFDRLIDILTLLFLSLLIFLLFFRAIGSYFLIIGGITILLSLLVILMIDSRSWLHKFFSR
ncbi:MAG: flippase-like domain-containing protein, partial [Candidatus Tagabacteria bacterium]